MATLGKISPCLGFNDKAEEAVEFYCSVFKNSKIIQKHYFPTDGSSPVPVPDGSVVGISFELDGQEFLALNGYSDVFNFTFGMSLMVHCKDQAEIDDLTAKLMANGGQQLDCGWVQDRFGMNWQIIPHVVNTLMKDPDEQRTQKVLKEIWTMQKLDVARIEKAYQDAGGQLLKRA